MSKKDDIRNFLNDLAPENESATPESGSINNDGDIQNSSINNTQVTGGHVGSIVSTVVHHHANSNESKATGTGERRTINRLADRLEDEFDQSRAEVWRDIHDTFGINAAKDLRQEQIKPAEKILYLQIEIAELRQTISEGETQRKVREEKIKQDRDKDVKNLSKLKQQNEQLEDDLARSQKKLQTLEFSYKKELENMRANLDSLKSRPQKQSKDYKAIIVMAFAFFAAIAAAGYFLTKNFSLAKDLNIARARIQICEFASNGYAVGSTLVRKDLPSLECAIVSSGAAPQWVVSKPKVEKKITPRKKPIENVVDLPDNY